MSEHVQLVIRESRRVRQEVPAKLGVKAGLLSHEKNAVYISKYLVVKWVWTLCILRLKWDTTLM